MRNKKRNNKGIALLLALIVLVVLFMLGTAYLTSMLSESGIARNQENSGKAFFLAEAGIDRAMRLIIESAELDTMPWSYQENMSDGYYIVDIAKAADIGDGFVRITSTGYANKAQRTSEAVIYLCSWKYLLMSNTTITFADTASGGIKGDIHANDAVFGAGISLGTSIDYKNATREPNKNQDVKFKLENNSGATVSLTHMTVSWDSPTAYYEEIKIKVEGGIDYRAVWKFQDNGNVRAASGEKVYFNSIVVIPDGSIAKVEIKKFKQNPNGGAEQDMDNTSFNIISWEYSDAFPTSVGVSATSEVLDIEGEISEGAPIISMPAIDMDAYRNRATDVITGDFTFNGYDEFVDQFRDRESKYNNRIFYVTGKATINTGLQNLTFDKCVLVAQDGIEIINTISENGIDYVELSRNKDPKESVIFQVQNNTDSDFTITHMMATWNPIAFYERITVEIIGGNNYGTEWSYPQRAAKGEIVALSSSPTIPAGSTAEIEILKFSKEKNKYKKKDMNREQVYVTFYSGAASYQTLVLKENEVVTAIDGKLKFKKQEIYPALITKYGDITEQDAVDNKQRDIEGVIYSEQGKVEFENLKLKGCIVSNEIGLIYDLDLDYKPRFIPDPPPDFIAGETLMQWQENY